MENALEQLTARIGDAVRVDPVTCENYRFDWSRDPTAGIPIAVVRPGGAAQVQTAIRWAAQHHIPVALRGAESGLLGGFRRHRLEPGAHALDREIDIAARGAVVEPGDRCHGPVMQQACNREAGAALRTETVLRPDA